MTVLSKLAKPFVYTEDVKVIPRDVVWVIIHKSVRNIPARIFADCICLERLDIQRGLVTIGNNAFCGCKSLKLVRLPETVRVVGAGAFSQCSALICVVLNEGLEKIGNFCFSYCLSMELFVSPLTLRTLGESVCEGCNSLEVAALNDGLDCVQPCSFDGCVKMKEIGIPTSMEQIGARAIPRSVTRQYKKSDELWSTIRDRVAKQAEDIQKEFPKSSDVASNDEKRTIEAPAKNPKLMDDQMKSVGSKLCAITEQTKEERKLKEPPKVDTTSLNKGCAKLPNEASVKPPAPDVSEESTADLKSDQVETKRLKASPLSFRECTTAGSEVDQFETKEFKSRKLSFRERMKARAKISERKRDEEPRFGKSSYCFKSSAAKESNEPWKERLETLEAKLEARDGETKAQLSVFQKQINELKEEMMKKDASMAPGLTEKLEKLHDLKTGLKNFGLKLQVAEQAEMISKSTCDVQKLDQRLMQLDKRTLSLAEKQEIDQQQQLASQKEYSKSLAGVSKKMGKMGATLKKIGNDALELDCRIQGLEDTSATKRDFMPKVDCLAANVATISRTLKDHVQRSDEKFEDLETNLENQEHCLEVMKRVVEFKLDKDQENIQQVPLVPNANCPTAGNKRPRDEVDDSSSGGLFGWTKSLLQRKKKIMKGGDK